MTDYTKFDPSNPPPPLMTGEPDSFARKTMINRVPGFVEQVLEDYQARYPEEIKRELQHLHDEVREDKPIQPLETSAPDNESWAKAWRPYQGQTWLNVPWYFAEVFFYRRLLEAAGYFGRYGDQWVGVDPFLPRKQAELHSDTTWRIVETALQLSSEKSEDSFKGMLYYTLWGNRLDLSHSQLAGSVDQISVDTEQANLIVDDSQAVLRHLRQPSRHSAGQNAPRIDVVCDNAGTELLTDLLLADFLLRMDWVGSITLHLKFHPTFISDATVTDVRLTIATLKAKRSDSLNQLAGRLTQFQQTGRLQLQTDRFWNSSRFFWEIPDPLQKDLAQAYLVIFKGDANYRRLLGDSRWPAAVPVADAVPYLPTAWVALRTMKSDPVVGLAPGQAEKLQQEDPEWRVNGRRGMIQALVYS